MAAIVALGVITLGAFAISIQANSSHGSPAAPAAAAPDYVYLTIAFNPMSGMDQFFPANFTVPSHTLVQFTIMNYDDGVNVVPLAAASVTGTVGGSASVLTGSPATAHLVTTIPLSQLSHTFTIGLAGLNVPIPATDNISTPNTIVFQAYFNESGALSWLCQAPCDEGSMAMVGYMSGIMTVD
jgi:hypothetical protein